MNRFSWKERVKWTAPRAGASGYLRRGLRLSAIATALLFGPALYGGSGAALAEEAAPPAVAAQVAPVNINKADAATLATQLKGVGPSRAEEIIRHREAYGPFASVDELAEVKGIGKSTLEMNRHLITLE